MYPTCTGAWQPGSRAAGMCVMGARWPVKAWGPRSRVPHGPEPESLEGSCLASELGVQDGGWHEMCGTGMLPLGTRGTLGPVRRIGGSEAMG